MLSLSCATARVNISYSPRSCQPPFSFFSPFSNLSPSPHPSARFYTAGRPGPPAKNSYCRYIPFYIQPPPGILVSCHPEILSLFVFTEDLFPEKSIGKYTEPILSCRKRQQTEYRGTVHTSEYKQKYGILHRYTLYPVRRQETENICIF